MILDKLDGSIYSFSGGDLDIQGGSTSIINGVVMVVIQSHR